MTNTNSDMKIPDSKKHQVPKKKSIIRVEAVVPFFIVVALVWAYFFFFFDHNLKKAIEYLGYQVVGAQVDVGSLNTSFFKGTIRIQSIQVTNPKKPTHNLLGVGDVRFGVSWDALLKAKFVVDEMAVEQIEVDGLRSSAGRVKPPEIKKESEGPSALDKAKDRALDDAQSKYKNNVMGDVAALLDGKDSGEQLKNIEGTLTSKKKIEEFQVQLQAKQKEWETQIKQLPTNDDVKNLNDQISKVKTKDFKSPDEVKATLDQINQIKSQAETKFASVGSLSQNLQNDFKKLDADYKAIEVSVNDDVKNLQSRLKIPQLDAKTLAHFVLDPYIGRYLGLIEQYRPLAQKYIPPNLLDKSKKPQENIKPHPRAKGVTYEFPNLKSYPLFWVKRISISSKALPGGSFGDAEGQILNITSNQKIIRKPTTLTFKGSFPAAAVSGLAVDAEFNDLNEKSFIELNTKVGSYLVEQKSLTDSPEFKLAMLKTNGHLESRVRIEGLSLFLIKLENDFNNTEFSVDAENAKVKEISTQAFQDVKSFDVNFSAEGALSDLKTDLRSNIGEVLQAAFSKQINAQIEQAKKQMQAYVDEQINKEKDKVTAEYNKIKSQIDGEVKKAQAQVDAMKAQADGKVKVAQKEFENQNKSKLENELKKQLGPDANQKLEELKKKFKF